MRYPALYSRRWHRRGDRTIRRPMDKLPIAETQSMVPNMPQAKSLHRLATYLFLAMFPLAVVGFWPTYVTKLTSTSISYHLHAFVLMLWMGMLLTQVVLVRTGRMGLHRIVGRSSFVVAPLLVVTAFVVTRQMLGGPGAERSPFVLQLLVLPLGAALQFSLTYALGIYYRKQPELHVRYMMSTAPILIAAATHRIFLNAGLSSLSASTNANFILQEVVAIALILNDLRLGKIRAPFVVLLVLTGVSHIMFLTVSETQWWHTLADWIGG